MLARLWPESETRLASEPDSDRLSALLPALAKMPRSCQKEQLTHSHRAITNGVILALANKLTI
ncbi:hypothetical protein SynBIOSE41_00956 [Synechococcus sp. BIOS-E4-1]|nr:hypothetical protein SynBIOSE41_00956 [Synechococcus sp. BIOS-E4-1]